MRLNVPQSESSLGTDRLLELSFGSGIQTEGQGFEADVSDSKKKKKGKRVKSST